MSLPKSEHPGNTHKLFLIPRWNPFLYGLPNEGLEKLEKKNERKIRERNGEFNFKPIIRRRNYKTSTGCPINSTTDYSHPETVHWQ